MGHQEEDSITCPSSCVRRRRMGERDWFQSSNSLLVWTNGKLSFALRINFSTPQCGAARHSFC
eukprot:7681516-Ditylum_brightwellii.AAC.2